MTAKQKALAVISALPDDTDPQEIIKRLNQIYSIARGLVQSAERRSKADIQASEHPALWGCQKGSVDIPTELDLTAPVLDDQPDAAHGRLHG